MLKRLFTSNTRIKLLTVFLMNLEGEFFIRELTRKLNEQINSVRRELDNLKKLGLLKSRAKNRKKYYYVNKEFILIDELRTIIIKALSSNDNLAKDIAKMGEVKLLVLSGQFIDRESGNIDMLIVGNIDKNKLADYIDNDIKSKRPIKFAIMSEEDYKYRVSCHDQFIEEIVSDPANQIPIKKF